MARAPASQPTGILSLLLGLLVAWWPVVLVVARSVHDSHTTPSHARALTQADMRAVYERRYGGADLSGRCSFESNSAFSDGPSACGGSEAASAGPTTNLTPKTNAGGSRGGRSGDSLHEIWLLPHTHDDVGWTETVSRYFNTSVQLILDSVTADLAANPTHRFIWSETKWVEMWWPLQNDSTREAFKVNGARRVDGWLGKQRWQ